MDKPFRSVLVVDDDAAIRALVVSVLQHAKVAIEQAATGGEAIRCIERTDYAAIVLDLMMPGGSGFDVIDCLQRLRPDGRRVIVISAAAPRVLRTVEEMPAVRAVLRKPFDIHELVAAVRECLA